MIVPIRVSLKQPPYRVWCLLLIDHNKPAPIEGGTTRSNTAIEVGSAKQAQGIGMGASAQSHWVVSGLD